MSDLLALTLAQIRQGFRDGDFSAEYLTGQYVRAIAAKASLNAYITSCADQALEAARFLDKKRQQSKPLGRLAAVPLAMKDLFCTKSIRTTCASRILKNYIPPYESTISRRLAQADSIMLGKTNMDEFAMGSANLNSAFGPVINPWSVDEKVRPLVPGGSSGGSAAAVAGHLAVAATGTDTGGSIRQPAAFCGIIGLKPTYGRCSRYGMIAFASSLDQAGPLSRTVEDAAWMLSVMAGYDSADSTSADRQVPDFVQGLNKGVKGLRVGIPEEYQIDGLNAEIARLWRDKTEDLKKAGATIVPINLRHTASALPAYYIIAPAEASSNLARYDGVRYGLRAKDDFDNIEAMYEKTRGLGFGSEVKRRIMIGTYVLSSGYYDAYYLRAARVRALIRQDFHQAFKQVDVILTPTTPGAAFALDAKDMSPLDMYINDVFTVPASLAGLPAVSVPVGLDEKGLPLALQMIAPAFAEDSLLCAASGLEAIADFKSLPPLVATVDA